MEKFKEKQRKKDQGVEKKGRIKVTIFQVSDSSNSITTQSNHQ
jgi:hypothetical protein